MSDPQMSASDSQQTPLSSIDANTSSGDASSQSASNVTQQSSTQLCVQSQNAVSTIDVSSTEQSLSQSNVSVPISAAIITHHPSALPSICVTTGVSSPSVSAQSSSSSTSYSQPLLTTNTTNVIGTTATISPATGQTVHIHAPHAHQTPILHTSVNQAQAASNMNMGQMSVSVTQLPQVQMIQQPMATAGTYQLQQLYPQQMLLPGNLTIQNMPFGTTNTGLSLQIPFTGTNAVVSGAMPISSMSGKTPIMSKGVAISPLTHIASSPHHMISPLKQNLAHGSAPLIKHVIPGQQFVSSSGNPILFNQFPTVLQQSGQQTILPATANRTISDHTKGKFTVGSVRSSFGSKMLSHGGTLHPKSPILPASSSISSSQLITNQHFKAFPTNANTAQLMGPAGLITNQPQLLSSFQTPQGITWTTAPQSAHLVAQNGSPIFIRTPGQHGEQMFIQTSTPQFQTVSMAHPVNVGNSGNSVQLTHGQSHLNATQITHIQPSVSSTAPTLTTSVVTSTQPAPIAPAPTAPTTTVRPRSLRPANSISSVATQTAASAIASQQKHNDSSTQPKPVASKPKATVTSTKSCSSAQTSTPLTIRNATVAVSTVSPQTNSQPTNAPQTKSDASNQTNKVSVATETVKVNTRSLTNDAPKNAVSKSSTTEVQTQPKSKPIEEPKPIKKSVEKKDASTEQDSEITNYYVQQQQQQKLLQIQQQQKNQQQTQNLNNVNPHQNGQMTVLTEANRHENLIKQPQKAIVKPQILTHVIDGYIIQESADPFPVNGLSYSLDQSETNDDSNKKYDVSINNDNNNIVAKNQNKNKNENLITNTPSSSSRMRNESSACHTCGKRKAKFKTKKSKRFCSSACADKFKNMERNRTEVYSTVSNHNTSNDQMDTSQTEHDLLETSTISTPDSNKVPEERKRVKNSKKAHENSNEWNQNQGKNLAQQNKSPIATLDGNGECSASSLNPNDGQLKGSDDCVSSVSGIYIPPGGKNPLKWNVQDVYEFVRNLQGCTEYADEFRSQEIDGQALMLLKEDHLMSAMNMKLGPALKICNKINALRDDVQKQN